MRRIRSEPGPYIEGIIFAFVVRAKGKEGETGEDIEIATNQNKIEFAWFLLWLEDTE